MFGAIADMGRAVRLWRIWSIMALQDIELRYRRSLLGPFWISASLVAVVLALAYIYSSVFRTDFREYIGHLGTGYLAWTFIVALVLEGCNSAQEHSAQISNVSFSLPVAAAHVVLRNIVIFIHNVAALLILLLIFGLEPSMLGFVAIAGVALIVCIGFCAAIALGPICSRFRDVRQVIESGMQVLFFLTPVFWSPEHVAGRPAIVDANPFYHLIELVRAPLLGRMPTDLNWFSSFVFAGTMAVFAMISLSVTRKRVALWV